MYVRSAKSLFATAPWPTRRSTSSWRVRNSFFTLMTPNVLRAMLSAWSLSASL